MYKEQRHEGSYTDFGNYVAKVSTPILQMEKLRHNS